MAAGGASGGHRIRTATRWLAGGAISAVLGLVVALVAPPAGAAPPSLPEGEAAGLELVGFDDLKREGLNGEVAVVGTTAVVASGVNPGAGVHAGMYNPYPCPRSKIEVVDVADPARPQVVGRILVQPGVSALDVAAASVSTPAFTGDLLAVALSFCGGEVGHHSGSGGGFNHHRGVAYYDVTDPAEPTFLGRYLADEELFDPDLERCDQAPRGDPPQPPKGSGACASSQHSVSLVQRPDGRVLSISTEPFATASRFPSGDLRIVDVTDPTDPVQVSAFDPYAKGDFSAAFSRNGCRPFGAGHAAELDATGTRAALAVLDEGVQEVDLTDPTAPALSTHVDPYPPADRLIEGNGGYASFAGSGHDLALLADEDWIAADSFLRVDAIDGTTEPSPQGLTVGETFACEAMFTLFDPEDSAQVYRHAGGQVPAGAGASSEFVYVGRGCPVNEDFGTTTPDPYVTYEGEEADVSGRIAVVDRFATSRQFVPDDPSSQLSNRGPGCQIAEKARRAQEEGAIAVVMDATFFGAAFSPDGDPTGLDIPVLAVDRPAGARLIETLCPDVDPSGSGRCVATTPVTGALVDRAGAWGGLRIVDLDSGVQVGHYASPRSLAFPPSDLGVYSAHHATAVGDRAYVAWNSDGLRVVDLTDPSAPQEVGYFVPPDTPDPLGVLPAKAFVTGVEVMGCHLLVSDVNSGLYVLRDPAVSCPS